MTSAADQVIASLERTSQLREATISSAIRALHLPPGSRGLDIGCGIGDQDLLLADAIRPNGHVTGLDISWALLDYARRRAGKSAFADRIPFEDSDMGALPFARGTFDWAWSVDCVGYPAGELPPILKGICRVVRPGGVIALLGWSSQELLPGHAMLEARLNAACSSYAPWLEGRPARTHFRRALHWFHEAELPEATCITLLGQVHAPLRPEIRDGIVSLFEMLWGDRIGEASAPDIEEYRRLCSPESPDFIGDLPEYCGHFTYTMFTARVPTALGRPTAR
jgi:demethylmenaquinone methyltransferase/2-methoxy-6-polyprenyl-1,4-benzoquinol methylase